MSVSFYGIQKNVKTAEPIRPKFALETRITFIIFKKNALSILTQRYSFKFENDQNLPQLNAKDV